jgi:hypothetical protein
MKSVECEPLPVESAPEFLSALELVVSGHEDRSHHAMLAAATSGASASRSAPATATGRLAGFTEAGVPLVEVEGGPIAAATPARTTVRLAPAHIGREVVVCFAAGDLRQPIVLGLLLAPAAAEPTPAPVELNGQRLEFNAEEELVLRCGKSSVTLTKAGKVLIRGEYLLSRSSGVNRIKGGSVQIN